MVMREVGGPLGAVRGDRGGTGKPGQSTPDYYERVGILLRQNGQRMASAFILSAQKGQGTRPSSSSSARSSARSPSLTMAAMISPVQIMMSPMSPEAPIATKIPMPMSRIANIQIIGSSSQSSRRPPLAPPRQPQAHGGG